MLKVRKSAITIVRMLTLMRKIMVGVDANDGTFSISMVVVDVGLAKKLTGPTLIGSGNPRFDWKWGQTGDILQVPV